MTFVVDGIAPHDLATALDQRGIAIRSGRHCAHPLHRRLGLSTSARASFTIYNDLSDIDALVDGILEIQRTYTPSADATSEDCRPERIGAARLCRRWSSLMRYGEVAGGPRWPGSP